MPINLYAGLTVRGGMLQDSSILEAGRKKRRGEERRGGEGEPKYYYSVVLREYSVQHSGKKTNECRTIE
jgi:hypothetical protein